MGRKIFLVLVSLLVGFNKNRPIPIELKLKFKSTLKQIIWMKKNL